MADHPPGSGWSETFQGGSREAEAEQFELLAEQMLAAQRATSQQAAQKTAGQQTAARGAAPAERGGSAPLLRALHAKGTLALPDAELVLDESLAPDLRHGFAQPGARYPVIARFSNAAAVPGSDQDADMRGAALRIQLGEGVRHDLLMTNFPVSYARDAHQFVALATATAGGGKAAVLGLLGVARRFGVGETVRMVRNVSAGRKHQPGSVFTETYWSRGALTWGPKIAVRYLLAPDGSAAELPAADNDPEYLHREAVGRLRAGPVRMHLFVQRYRDEHATPIEDTSVEWTEDVAPREHVATLTLHAAEPDSDDARDRSAEVEATVFNPWNHADGFRPLGHLNRARAQVYGASGSARGART